MWTLLIADDERTIREGMAFSIDWKALGIDRVFLAADGREAYEMIKKEKPDIAIIDIIMPEMTGVEVIARLKEEGENTEFIIISGYSEFNYAREAIRYHVNNYILKPCDIEEIINTTKKIIDKLTHQHLIEKERRQLNLIKSQVQEQILRDFILGNLQEENMTIIGDILTYLQEKLQLLLFCPENNNDYKNLIALKKYIENKFPFDVWHLIVMLYDGIVLIFKAEDRTKIEAFARQFYNELTGSSFKVKIAISEKDIGGNLPQIYQKTREVLKICSPLTNEGENILIDASIACTTYSRIIRQVIQYVHDNLDNSSLSLQYIATRVLYLNPDYLGKLFKKECGIKFSDYLMKIRIEKAKEILATSGEIKMYEVARRVGFGENVAYFSRVFRKYTGLLPSEYRAKFGH